jgi:hypothetical protein
MMPFGARRKICPGSCFIWRRVSAGFSFFF